MNQNSTTKEQKPKQSDKKTQLDMFKLFYEEIPLELENRTIKSEKRSKDRLVRRSRARY